MGDCPTLLNMIYENFEADLEEVPAWADIPWGLGAWGSNDESWVGVIPQEDREHCINSVRDQLESGEYPRFKAAIAFNSLESRIDEERSPEMLETFTNYLLSDAFYDPDYEYTADELTFGSSLCSYTSGLCNDQCDDSCYWSFPTVDPN